LRWLGLRLMPIL